MIRAPAALDLARDILQPFIEQNMVSETLVQLAGSLIQKAVEIDEKQQEIEKLEASLG